MTFKKQSNIKSEFGYLLINGKYYKPEMLRGETIFREISKTKVLKNLKLIEEIIEKLKDNLDKKAILRESLMKYSQDIGDEGEKWLIALHNALYNSKRKVKPKTREHRCVDMKIGNIIVPIID
jgi:hypothetical protein